MTFIKTGLKMHIKKTFNYVRIIFNEINVLNFLHAHKRRLKITQLQKECFIQVNELKLTQLELFLFFHFMCATVNASKLYCMAELANNERFLYRSNLSF